jgi:hypothetical protein
VIAELAMGDHPEFERTTFVSGMPLADDTFYALTPTGALDLTPFIVMRYCAMPPA